MERCSMKGERHPIILLRTEKKDWGFANGKKLRHVEFHKVDLMIKQGQVDKNCYPNLMSWGGIGDFFHFDQKMYVLGGMSESQSRDDVYERGYVLDNCTWKEFTLPINNNYSHPRCAILDEKLYHFEFPERHDPLVPPGPLEIVLLPPKFVAADCCMSPTCLPDPRNNRILINLFSNQLYAYYPLRCEFELVGKIFTWSTHVALDDNNVLYVYCEEDNFLAAYDLSHMAKRLKVVWAKAVGFKFALLDYDALFYVGNNNFWFAIWSPDYDNGNATLYFVKFQVQRVEDKIICTPLALQEYLLESTIAVHGFHLLDEEACG